jgi:hypothetical protein
MPALQAGALPLGHVVEEFRHAVQGSNLPFRDLEARAPPLEQTARVQNVSPRRARRTQRRKFQFAFLSVVSVFSVVNQISNAQGRIRTSDGPLRSPGLQPGAFNRSATYASQQGRGASGKGRERSFLRLPLAPHPLPLFASISVEGFEPSTPSIRGSCATKLRYTLKRIRMKDEG